MKPSTIAAALLALATGDAVLACVCTPPNATHEAFASVDVVFVGAAVGFEVEERRPDELWDTKVGVWNMVVTQVFKGPPQLRFTIITDITSSCAFEFQLHEQFVVFARHMADGQLTTGACSATAPTFMSRDVLAELPEPILDVNRPGGAASETSTEHLLTILESSTDARSRVGAWTRLEERDVPVKRLFAAAERSLVVGGDGEWLLAVEALDTGDWAEIDPYPFLKSVLARGKWLTVHQAMKRLAARFDRDPALVHALGKAVLEREDPQLDDEWLRLTTDDAIVADAIVELFHKPDGAGFERAVHAVVTRELADPRFGPWLTANLDASEGESFSVVAWALGYQGPSAVPPLIGLLSSEVEWARESAAYGLGLVGPPAKEAIGSLTRALADESEEVRDNAAVALERIEPGLGWPFYEALLGGDSSDRVRAAEFLRSLRTDKAVAEMIRRLSDADCPPHVVFGLGEAGAKAAGALPRLRQIAGAKSDLSSEAARAVLQIERAIDDD